MYRVPSIASIWAVVSVSVAPGVPSITISVAPVRVGTMVSISKKWTVWVIERGIRIMRIIRASINIDGNLIYLLAPWSVPALVAYAFFHEHFVLIPSGRRILVYVRENSSFFRNIPELGRFFCE